MLSDFFTATADELANVDIATGPSTQAPCLRAKHVDPVKIVQLQCCIEGVEFEERISLLDEIFVRDGGDDGPWIIRLPEHLETALALFNPPDIDRYGRAWAETEEWQRDGGTPDLIIPLLGEIVRLVAAGRAEDQSTFVWICL